MGAALLSLGGALLSLYLYLYKLGFVRALACGEGGGCDTVQFSAYARFLGVEVTLIGLLGYGGLLAAALAGLQPRAIDAPGPSRLLLLLASGGLAFTAWLKYAEFVMIGAVCLYCVISAILIALIFVLALLDWRRTRTPT